YGFSSCPSPSSCQSLHRNESPTGRSHRPNCSKRARARARCVPRKEKTHAPAIPKTAYVEFLFRCDFERERFAEHDLHASKRLDVSREAQRQKRVGPRLVSLRDDANVPCRSPVHPHTCDTAARMEGPSGVLARS